MPITIATATASFRARELSEDRLAVHRVPGGVVVVVADGAGGIPGGGLAADLAIKVIEEAAEHGAFNMFSGRAWVDLMVHADAIIETDRVAGETTCVIVVIANDGRVVGASVGDSGALIIGSDGSVDDLTAGQHRKRRLGSGQASPVTFERSALDGTLVVASDGLLAYARPDAIARIVTEHEDLDAVAEALVERIRLPGRDLVDDLAILLVKPP